MSGYGTGDGEVGVIMKFTLSGDGKDGRMIVDLVGWGKWRFHRHQILSKGFFFGGMNLWLSLWRNW